MDIQYALRRSRWETTEVDWSVERMGIRERLGKKADGRTAGRGIWKDWDCESSGDREQKLERRLLAETAVQYNRGKGRGRQRKQTDDVRPGGEQQLTVSYSNN